MKDAERREAEIRERTEQATPGPWEQGQNEFAGPATYRNVYAPALAELSEGDDAPSIVLCGIYRVTPEQAAANAAFVAHAREDVPWLLERLAAERAARREAEAERERLHATVCVVRAALAVAEALGREG